MKKRTNRIYTTEFKQEAVALVTKQATPTLSNYN